MSATPFSNEPILELRRAAARETLVQGLRAVDARLPLSVPVLVGGDSREGDALVSTDPGNPRRVVATSASASAAEVDEAVRVATRGAVGWAATAAADRAQALIHAAAWMRERRAEIAALMVRECAKPWAEADGDVCEAIDFLEYYARGAVALESGRALLQAPGERNEMRYVARGVCAVIAPWNFPVAIPCGMAAAALATGNAAILKPAEQSPACGHIVIQALRAGGVPDDAIALLPGEGEIGAALVAHPGVHTIAFTGSAAVGLEILSAAARTPDDQHHLKRVVAEMGGKNCVLVDADADLDEAVPGIVTSAFAYAGQKCSAAARVLVHEAVADLLIERVAGAVDVLAVGQADTFGTEVPPVIEQSAQERVQRYSSEAARDGSVVSGAREDVPNDGWFCPPLVAADLDPASPVLAEEVFGPLLTIERMKDLDQAVERVRALPFALTGGLFARNPRAVARIAAALPVGNLYINRAITGAMVGRQPFGGNRLSGTGTKAGGPDYLLSFVDPRVITENTVRHGLVV